MKAIEFEKVEGTFEVVKSEGDVSESFDNSMNSHKEEEGKVSADWLEGGL